MLGTAGFFFLGPFSSPHPFFRTLDAAALTWKQPKAPASDPGRALRGPVPPKKRQKECVWVSRLLSKRDRQARHRTAQLPAGSAQNQSSPSSFLSAPLPLHPKPSNLQSCRAFLNLQRAIRLHRLVPLFFSSLLSYFNLGSSIKHYPFIHLAIRIALRCERSTASNGLFVVWSSTRSVPTQRSLCNFSFSPAASSSITAHFFGCALRQTAFPVLAIPSPSLFRLLGPLPYPNPPRRSNAPPGPGEAPEIPP